MRIALTCRLIIMTALGAAASTTHAKGVVSSLATGISGCLGMVFFALGVEQRCLATCTFVC